MADRIEIPQSSDLAGQLDQIASTLLIDAEGQQPDPAPQPEPEPEPAPDRDPEPSGVDPEPEPDDAPGEPLAADDGEAEEQTVDLDDDTLVTVKIDGQYQDVTFGELKRGYSGQARINRGNDELAALRKQEEEDAAHAAQNRSEYAAALQRIENLHHQAEPDIDWDGLKAADPDEWVKQRALLQERQERLGRIRAEQQRVQAEQRAYEQQQRDAYLRAQAIEIAETIPELADPETAPAVQQMIEKFALKNGYTPESFSQISDAKTFRALYLGAKALKDQRSNPAPEPKPKRRVRARVKPGRGPSPSTPTDKQKKRQERAIAKAKETGHADDVAMTLLTTR